MNTSKYLIFFFLFVIPITCGSCFGDEKLEQSKKQVVWVKINGKQIPGLKKIFDRRMNKDRVDHQTEEFGIFKKNGPLFYKGDDGTIRAVLLIGFVGNYEVIVKNGKEMLIEGSSFVSSDGKKKFTDFKLLFKWFEEDLIRKHGQKEHE